METLALWLLRLVDAGPEFYVLLAGNVGFGYVVIGKIKGLEKQSTDSATLTESRFAAQIATEKEENSRLWAECRQQQERQNNDVRQVNHLHHKDRNTSDARHREDLKLEVARLENQIQGLKEICHRLDALNYGQSKVIEATTGVKLINGSANGAGDYTLNREIIT